MELVGFRTEEKTLTDEALDICEQLCALWAELHRDGVLEARRTKLFLAAQRVLVKAGRVEGIDQ